MKDAKRRPKHTEETAKHHIKEVTTYPLKDSREEKEQWPGKKEYSPLDRVSKLVELRI